MKFSVRFETTAGCVIAPSFGSTALSDRRRAFLHGVSERGLLYPKEPLEAMSQHRSQREEGVSAGGDSPGSTSADGEVRVGLTDVIFGNGPEAPQYGRVFAGSVIVFFRAIR